MQQVFGTRSKLVYALCAFALCFIALAVIGYFASKSLGLGHLGPGASFGDGYVALIEVEGAITASDTGGGMFGSSGLASSVELCSKLYAARDDESVKAVLLRINSPGGSAAASDEIYRAVKALRESGKPVVVSMGDVAASGGYYIASAADYIFANGATLTGSIGVIFELLNWDKAAQKLGVESETLHAGEFKDIGSPWRDMTDREREMMMALLDQVHTQFINAVDDGRANLDEAQVRKLATGMIYTGEEAKKVGLIDEVGSLEDAKAKARALAKLPADAPVEGFGDSGFWEEFFAMRSGNLDPWTAWRGMAGAGLERLAQSLFLNSTARDLIVR